MKVEDAIRKAIEGGWKEYRGFHLNDIGVFPANDVLLQLLHIHDGGVSKIEISYAELFLDPSFWQSLGKALGWKPAVVIECACGRKGRKKTFLHHWHRLINHLADGKTAEEFFESL